MKELVQFDILVAFRCISGFLTFIRQACYYAVAHCYFSRFFIPITICVRFEFLGYRLKWTWPRLPITWNHEKLFLDTNVKSLLTYVHYSSEKKWHEPTVCSVLWPFSRPDKVVKERSIDLGRTVGAMQYHQVILRKLSSAVWRSSW